MKKIVLILCIAALMCMTSLAAPVSAATLTVAADGTGDYTSFSAAINAASSGDIIFLHEGVYSESGKITISKTNITIKGDGADKVTLSMSRNLRITGSKCTIENMKFMSGFKVLSIESSNCIVRNNIFEKPTGIEIYSSYNQIFNNIILNPNSPSGGINIVSGTYNDIHDNVITGATGYFSSAAIYDSSNFFENNSIYGSSVLRISGANNTIAKKFIHK
jgi:hypothetical protein